MNTDRTILFSPLGMTDPIRYFYDGAMLNIVRNYMPDIIYFYMSKEICEYHELDNRYIYCVEQLGKLIGKSFETKIIKRPELEDVQLFDGFINEFTVILNGIHEKYPDYSILLNVSSGTPAMKSSLQILSLTLDYRTIPVQVSTPQKQSNPRINDEKNASREELWELNESNIKKDNRCIISETRNLMTEFKKQILIKLIRSYDYSAAFDLAYDMNIFSEKFMKMLSSANSRLKLNFFDTKKTFNKYGYIISVNAKKEFEEIFEYVLLLKIKIIKQEYADFIRAITPAILHMFEIYLKEKCKIIVDDFVQTDSKGVRRWSKEKMSGTDIYKYLEEVYNDGFKSNTAVNSDSCYKLIEKYSPDADILKCALSLRNIEKQIRNKAAHTIVRVTEKDIKRDTGFTVDEIFNMLILMLKFSGFDTSNKCIKSYDNMNEYILSEM